MTREELGALYSRYGFLIQRRCLAVLGNPQDASDAVQETFMRAQRYPPGEVESMLGWLYAVSFRVCLDQMKGRRQRGNWLAQATLAAKSALGAPPPPQADTRLVLGEELARLDDRSRQIALLYYLEGMTQEEIAERTGYSRKTIGQKLKILEEQLREALSHEKEGEASWQSL